MGGCIDGHAAPAGTNFQQVITGLERELLADALKFIQLRLLKAVVSAFKHGRRVHHGWVEELFKQVITQVVMRRDVFARTFARVAIEPVQPLDKRATELCQAAFHSVEYIQVADKYANHRRQVWRCPVTVDIGFTRANRAITRDQPPHRTILHVDFSAQVGVRVAEFHALVAFHNHQLAMT